MESHCAFILLAKWNCDIKQKMLVKGSLLLKFSFLKFMTSIIGFN